MKNKIYFISIIFVFFSSLLLCAEKDNLLISPGLLHKQWPAYWIEVPGEPHHSFGVYLFRKEFNLEKIPSLPNSLASPLVNPIIPALVVEYTLLPGTPSL